MSNTCIYWIHVVFIKLRCKSNEKVQAVVFVKLMYLLNLDVKGMRNTGFCI